MTSVPTPSSRSDAPPTTAEFRKAQYGTAAIVILFAVLALLSPFTSSTPAVQVGTLLVATALLEMYQGLRRATSAGQRRAFVGGAITLAMGLLLCNAPRVAGAVVVLALAGSFALDGLRYLWRVVGPARTEQPRTQALLAAAGNFGAMAVALMLTRRAAPWTLAVLGAMRIAGTGWTIFTAPVHGFADAGDTALDDLGLRGHPEMQAVADRIEAEEGARAYVDRGWIVAFLLTLLAIHVGRMGFDRTALGLFSPAFAVLGDAFVAVLLAFAIVVPLHLGVRRLTRGVERSAWAWVLGAPRTAGGKPSLPRRLVRRWLESRLRFSIRLRAARYSFGTAIARGLQIGLPVAAIIAATAPVWGMSWYFDTENWAAGVWNSWAEKRTDTWREAMVQAATAREQGSTRPGGLRFAVQPAGVGGAGDFSFIVIGDTGEGDASQHVLRDQLLRSAQRDDVKFVVVSSDVVYPTGAMKDYEANFWLPFKGVEKPVYAIPGNHDWYDALEGFLATFLEPGAARAAIRARIEVDKKLTSTTDATVEDLVARAAELRSHYRVPTGLQEAPFFQVQTDRFALVAVDTGVARRVDSGQLAWLRSALEAARGKTIMAVLGHPFYAGGGYTAEGDAEFSALHQLLRDHDVAVVMAGDTHDLEYYGEPKPGGGVRHHFVNGGGGAYLSFGTALAWPAAPATPTWAFYPNRLAVREKIATRTPWWKQPAWIWTTRYNAWPSSPEWLSAMFDYNVAPFFQSFVEVHVEPSAGRVRLVPVGVHGRLRWSELDASAGARSSGASDGDFVEWIVPMEQ